MDTAKEIVSLMKFSPKRENVLGEIKENLEGSESEPRANLAFAPLDGQYAQAVFSES